MRVTIFVVDAFLLDDEESLLAHAHIRAHCDAFQPAMRHSFFTLNEEKKGSYVLFSILHARYQDI